MRTRKEIILGTLSDLAAGFMYYDRKEDEFLPKDAIEQAVKAGEITPKEMAIHFIKECGFKHTTGE